MKVPLAPAARPAATAASSGGSISASSTPSTAATAAGLPAFFTASPCRAKSSLSALIRSDSHAHLGEATRPRAGALWISHKRVAVNAWVIDHTRVWSITRASSARGGPVAEEGFRGLRRLLEGPPVAALQPHQLGFHPVRQAFAEFEWDV